MQRDRYGLDYDELLGIQRQHLVLWAERLKPDLYAQIEPYVLKQNIPATNAETSHQVHRGQTIIEIIRTWPNVNEDLYGPKVDDCV